MAVALVVFDMAGTTVEDKDYVHAALIDAFSHDGLNILRDEANQVMGIPKPQAIRHILTHHFGVKQNLQKRIDKIHQRFLDEMIRFYRHDPSVNMKPGTAETFEALKSHQIRIGINTGFSRNIADAIIDRLQWKKNGLIDFSITSDEVAKGRPYPDMIFKTMEALHIPSADRVAKVGDTVSDLEEGKNAGCRFIIGVTTGAYTEKELKKGPHTHLVKELTEIVPIITEK